jgi:hypothetical protein
MAAAASDFSARWDAHSRAQLAERAEREAQLRSETVVHRRAAVERILGRRRAQQLETRATPLRAQQRFAPRAPWRRYTNEELLALYPRSTATEEK